MRKSELQLLGTGYNVRRASMCKRLIGRSWRLPRAEVKDMLRNVKESIIRPKTELKKLFKSLKGEESVEKVKQGLDIPLKMTLRRQKAPLRQQLEEE